MNTISVSHSAIEKQVYLAATKLIEGVIDLKSDKTYKSVLEHPHLKFLLERVDIWTDFLVAKEGGL